MIEQLKTYLNYWVVDDPTTDTPVEVATLEDMQAWLTQKHIKVESEVSDDFCEWEWKNDFDTNGFLTQCEYKMTELYADHNYKYCPHCGKKIRIK